jgi:hypothetical protein
MQGHKQFSDRVVLCFRLSERVPKQNLYRRLAELLDWSFLYEETRALYSHTGQPSLDPVAAWLSTAPYGSTSFTFWVMKWTRN